MKLTQHQLKKIISEEFNSVLKEQESNLNLPKQDAKKALKVAKMTKIRPKVAIISDIKIFIPSLLFVDNSINSCSKKILAIITPTIHPII